MVPTLIHLLLAAELVFSQSSGTINISSPQACIVIAQIAALQSPNSITSMLPICPESGSEAISWPMSSEGDGAASSVGVYAGIIHGKPNCVMSLSQMTAMYMLGRSLSWDEGGTLYDENGWEQVTDQSTQQALTCMPSHLWLSSDLLLPDPATLPKDDPAWKQSISLDNTGPTSGTPEPKDPDKANTSSSSSSLDHASLTAVSLLGSATSSLGITVTATDFPVSSLLPPSSNSAALSSVFQTSTPSTASLDGMATSAISETSTASVAKGTSTQSVAVSRTLFATSSLERMSSSINGIPANAQSQSQPSVAAVQDSFTILIEPSSATSNSQQPDTTSSLSSTVSFSVPNTEGKTRGSSTISDTTTVTLESDTAEETSTRTAMINSEFLTSQSGSVTVGSNTAQAEGISIAASTTTQVEVSLKIGDNSTATMSSVVDVFSSSSNLKSSTEATESSTFTLDPSSIDSEKAATAVTGVDFTSSVLIPTTISSSTSSVEPTQDENDGIPNVTIEPFTLTPEVIAMSTMTVGTEGFASAFSTKSSKSEEILVTTSSPLTSIRTTSTSPSQIYLDVTSTKVVYLPVAALGSHYSIPAQSSRNLTSATSGQVVPTTNLNLSPTSTQLQSTGTESVATSMSYAQLAATIPPSTSSDSAREAIPAMKSATETVPALSSSSLRDASDVPTTSSTPFDNSVAAPEFSALPLQAATRHKRHRRRSRRGMGGWGGGDGGGWGGVSGGWSWLAGGSWGSDEAEGSGSGPRWPIAIADSLTEEKEEVCGTNCNTEAEVSVQGEQTQAYQTATGKPFSAAPAEQPSTPTSAHPATFTVHAADFTSNAPDQQPSLTQSQASSSVFRPLPSSSARTSYSSSSPVAPSLTQQDTSSSTRKPATYSFGYASTAQSSPFSESVMTIQTETDTSSFHTASSVSQQSFTASAPSQNGLPSSPQTLGTGFTSNEAIAPTATSTFRHSISKTGNSEHTLSVMSTLQQPTIVASINSSTSEIATVQSSTTEISTYRTATTEVSSKTNTAIIQTSVTQTSSATATEFTTSTNVNTFQTSVTKTFVQTKFITSTDIDNFQTSTTKIRTFLSSTTDVNTYELSVTETFLTTKHITSTDVDTLQTSTTATSTFQASTTETARETTSIAGTTSQTISSTEILNQTTSKTGITTSTQAVVVPSSSSSQTSSTSAELPDITSDHSTSSDEASSISDFVSSSETPPLPSQTSSSEPPPEQTSSSFELTTRPESSPQSEATPQTSSEQSPPEPSSDYTEPSSSTDPAPASSASSSSDTGSPPDAPAPDPQNESDASSAANPPIFSVDGETIGQFTGPAKRGIYSRSPELSITTTFVVSTSCTSAQTLAATPSPARSLGTYIPQITASKKQSTQIVKERRKLASSERRKGPSSASMLRKEERISGKSQFNNWTIM
ncbi:uncharacterized protein I206_107641 [Kwoniella pini CBS 10737]|uniref:Uncharacterized protein n=1 Tax=Kwoniella pini CBS 10737 TaxID=1296096 RepID=A0A1B9HXZ4_9TREE|nr:uncharacterized protein I206_05976 [Kwoniella pini CBS 10737]OCF48108.1 hypothetical protein I206_05976 [Kwoniella pini CBS 10737]